MKPRFKIFQKENEERTLDVIIYYPVNFAARSFVAYGTPREISLVRYIPKRRTPSISHLTGIARSFISSYEPHGHVGLI